MFNDIRYACRGLIAQPGWTLAAVLCLAIGAGANTATFTVINGLLLRPLPFIEPHQLVMVAVRESAIPARPFSLAEFRDIESAAGDFGLFAARTFQPSSVAGDGPARMVQAEMVTLNYFDMLKVKPFAGRWFAGPSGSEAVISQRLWRIHFNSEPSILGRLIRVNGRPVTVCGIAPAGFVGAMQLIKADMWLPAAKPDSVPMFGVMGRLKPGVSPDQARQRLDAILGSRSRPLASVVELAAGFGVPPALRKYVVGGSALLFGLMALMVAVTIANVAGLMLARATGRRRDISLRLALGASPSRIVRQVLTESLVLASVGAGLGMLLAMWLPRVLTGFGPRLPEHLAYAIDVRPDWTVFAYAAFMAVVVAGLFGLVPARRMARIELVEALKQGGGGGRGIETSRILNGFVVGQVAVSTVLLVAAGLLVRTHINTQRVDPGIDTRNALAVSIDLDQVGYDAAAGNAFYTKLLSRVSVLPGVRAATLTSPAPLAPGGNTIQIWTDGAVQAGSIVTTPEYFNALGVPLLDGRNFTPLDRGAPGVAIVNETMAGRLWLARSPIGQTFRLGGATGQELQVIGVARDIKYRKVSEDAQPVFYQPVSQAYRREMTLVVRTLEDPHRLIEFIRREVQSQSSDLALVDVRTLEDQLREGSATARQSAAILTIVCAIGLLLSSLGLFGVMSYGVRSRTREFGLRMALGAQPASVMAMVLRQGMRLVLVGFMIGIPAALVLTRVLQSLLFGVRRADSVTFVIVAGILLAIALAASYLPARWATRVDPTIALRSE